MPTRANIYSALPVVDDADEVRRTMATGSRDDLMTLALAVGETWPDWHFAQDVCLQLAEHADAGVRANACLGLAYIARVHRRLEKHRVKPILLRELRSQTELKWRIEDAIDDINQFLKWRIAKRPRHEQGTATHKALPEAAQQAAAAGGRRRSPSVRSCARR